MIEDVADVVGANDERRKQKKTKFFSSHFLLPVCVFAIITMMRLFLSDGMRRSGCNVNDRFLIPFDLL